VFVEEPWDQIADAVNESNKICLEVILLTPFGPAAIERDLVEGLKRRGVNINDAINWWSAASSFGILELETEDGLRLYIVWAYGEDNRILKITPKDEIDLNIILDSLASSNVAPGVMRAFSHARFPEG
jgi:hypothetical protein